MAGQSLLREIGSFEHGPDPNQAIEDVGMDGELLGSSGRDGDAGECVGVARMGRNGMLVAGEEDVAGGEGGKGVGRLLQDETAGMGRNGGLQLNMAAPRTLDMVVGKGMQQAGMVDGARMSSTSVGGDAGVDEVAGGVSEAAGGEVGNDEGRLLASEVGKSRLLPDGEPTPRSVELVGGGYGSKGELGAGIGDAAGGGGKSVLLAGMKAPKFVELSEGDVAGVGSKLAVGEPAPKS